MKVYENRRNHLDQNAAYKVISNAFQEGANWLLEKVPKLD